MLKIAKTTSMIIITMLFIPILSSLSDSFNNSDNSKPIETRNDLYTFEAPRIEEVTTHYIDNSDPFLLSITNFTTNTNITNVSIQELGILFSNGTEIAQVSTEDNVTILVYNEKDFSELHELEFHNETPFGWMIDFNVRDYNPGIYYIDLHAETGDYYYDGRLYVFEIVFDILFQEPLFVINNVSKTMGVCCRIRTEPFYFTDYVLFDSDICVSIYNSSNHNISTLSLEYSGFSGYWKAWFLNNSIEDFEEGSYYVIVSLKYEGKLFLSNPSEIQLFIASIPTHTPIEIMLPIIVLAFLGTRYLLEKNHRFRISKSEYAFK